MHPVVAYNLVMILSFIASAFAMYLLAERLTGSRAASFVAGLLFGFYPYRFEHYSHFELQMTYCMPLALLALHRFLTSARTRDAVAFASAGRRAALLARCTTPSSSRSMPRRSLAFLCLLQRPPLRRMLGPAVIAGALALALAVPLARTYSSARLGDRDVATVTYYSATAADYLRAHPRSATWGNHTLPGRMPERALFPGVMILLLAAVALIPPPRRRRARRTPARSSSPSRCRAGFNSVFYPYLYEWLPFIRGLRVPARASILVGLTLALLAGFGVRRLLAGRSAWLQRGVLAVLVRRDRDRPAPGAAARAGLARAAAHLRARRGLDRRRPRRVSVRRQPHALHAERAVHVLLALALGADDQRLQRALSAGTSRLRGGVERVSRRRRRSICCARGARRT